MKEEMPVSSRGLNTESRMRLLECIERHAESLLGSISLYTRRIGLDGEGDARELATDILQETVIEALDHADNFLATRQPFAWLMGIAVNIIRRRKVALAKRSRREISLSHLAARQPTSDSDQDILDSLTPLSETTSEPEMALEGAEEVASILSLVSPADQEVVRLAVLDDCEREMLAQRLGISEGAARTRLHRALRRLRKAWMKHQEPKRKGEPHE